MLDGALGRGRFLLVSGVIGSVRTPSIIADTLDRAPLDVAESAGEVGVGSVLEGDMDSPCAGELGSPNLGKDPVVAVREGIVGVGKGRETGVMGVGKGVYAGGAGSKDVRTVGRSIR